MNMKSTAQQLSHQIEHLRHSIKAYEADFAKTGFEISRKEALRMEAEQAELKKQLSALKNESNL